MSKSLCLLWWPGPGHKTYHVVFLYAIMNGEPVQQGDSESAPQPLAAADSLKLPVF